VIAAQEGEASDDVERNAHAIYGLIIITATLVADGVHAEDALVSILVLWGAALVLVLAHIYSALIAELELTGQRLTYVERRVLIADNIPVAGSVVIPTLLLVGAGLGLISLQLAIDLSIILSIMSLFALGAFQARRHHASVSRQLAIGALGGALGVVVVLAEVTLSH
jgi:hypothetical protein